MPWALKSTSDSSQKMQIIFSPNQSSHPVSTGQPGFQQGLQRAPSPREHTTATGHHRIDTRTVWTQSTCLPPVIKPWAGLQRLSSWNGRVGSGTKLLTKCSFTSALCRPTVLKLPPPFASIVENGLHWTLMSPWGRCLSSALTHAPHNLSSYYDALLSMRSIESQANTVSGRSQARSNGLRYAAALPDPKRRRQFLLSIAFEMRLPW